MTDQQYDTLKSQYLQESQRQAAAAKAYYSQSMAKLIARCLDDEGWDSKKVEAKERRSQKWVWNMADFGRFLSVSTKCTNSDSHKLATLNEGTYRKHKSTCGSSDHAVILEHILGSPEPTKATDNEKAELRRLVFDFLADGKWRFFKHILACLQEHVEELTSDKLQWALHDIERRQPSGRTLEKKTVSKGNHQYRLTKRITQDDVSNAILQVYEKISPLLEQLDYWGKQHEYHMSPSEIQKIATQLRRVFDAILDKSKT
jgi:hypothetical protein